MGFELGRRYGSCLARATSFPGPLASRGWHEARPRSRSYGVERARMLFERVVQPFNTINLPFGVCLVPDMALEENPVGPLTGSADWKLWPEIFFALNLSSMCIVSFMSVRDFHGWSFHNNYPPGRFKATQKTEEGATINRYALTTWF